METKGSNFVERHTCPAFNVQRILLRAFSLTYFVKRVGALYTNPCTSLLLNNHSAKISGARTRPWHKLRLLIDRVE